MRLSLLGPPGAGKGTQAVRLSADLKLPHVATGDMLRAAIAAGDPVGIEAKRRIDRGALVPDETMVQLVKQRLAKPDCAAGVLFDGFPRTVAQADALEKVVRLDRVVLFEVAAAALVERLGGRRVCSKCGRNFHVRFAPPKAAGACDACAGALIQRDDDREEAIRNRLQVYEEQTAPLAAYYDARKTLRRVDAAAPPDRVYESLRRALG